MSTLTKVLIVLLTVSSMALCGFVVAYVANADNQRKRADDLQTRLRSSEARQRAAEEDKANALKEALDKETELKGEISQLQTEITKLQAQAAEFARTQARLAEDKKASEDAAAQAINTLDNVRDMYKTSQDTVARLESERTNREKELDELNLALKEKMALLAQLEQSNKQLTEANQDMSNRLNQYLQQYGRIATLPDTATATTGAAVPAVPPATKEIALKGRVTGVNLQDGMAQISIGSASGVKPNMTFYVTRGATWICDVVISNVDPDKAVGNLSLFDRSRGVPQVGDVVSTNL